MTDSFPVAVYANTLTHEPAARELALELQLPLCPTNAEPPVIEAYSGLLVLDADGIFLQQTGHGAPGPIRVEFGNAKMRHRRKGGHNELLGKSVGLSKKQGIHVLDATAGLGRDGFLLADLGCQLSLCERNPLIFQMLRSGLASANRSGDPWVRSVATRIELLAGDSTALSREAMGSVEVIYLDPMFPDRSKAAKVKKEMALFHALLGSGRDADELLLWALQQDVARVVVKRPIKAPRLAGREPSHVIAGKAVRYDVYVFRSLV